MYEVQDIRKKDENTIHIRIRERFSASVAMDLAALMKNTFYGEGTVCVYMGHITEIDQDAGDMMKQLIDKLGLPRQRIVFTGVNGLLLMSGDKYRATIPTCACQNCRGRRNCKHDRITH